MGELRGTGIGRGVAAGRVIRLPDQAALPLDQAGTPPASGAMTEQRNGADRQAEGGRALAALARVAADLRERALRANREGVEILGAQALMATDPQLAEEVLSLVDGGAAAPRAISDALDGYAERLAGAGGYLAERVADLVDIKRRAVAECIGAPQFQLPQPGHPYVLVANDLAPADTVTLDERVLALITVEGGPTSHTAILARAMGIPAVVGCPGALSLADGDLVTVDAARGLVLRGAHHVPMVALSSQLGPGRTADGHPVALQANIGAAEDIDAALAAGAEGVGLLRTEFFTDYAPVFEAFAGSRVVVRAFDAGADKPLPGLSRSVESNPALGIRGIRALMRHPDVLDAQLAAISSAASATGADVWVMAPMVSDPSEAAWFTARVRQHGLATAGVMIEVPSAALLAAQLLAEADFASIGTNDLVQFTLAADRQLGALAALQDPAHPAVLCLIELTAKAGKAMSKPIGVCGEAAADPWLACVLVGLGVDSLSMAPNAIAEVRSTLAQHTLEQCRELAARAMLLQ